MGKEKKGAKFGRNRDRNPSSRAYTLGKRWLVNKAKAIKRHTRRMAKLAIKRLMRADPSRRDHSRLQELRYIVSQNHTGASA